MKSSQRQSAEDMFPDPEPGDDNDPEYQEEMFRTFQYMGWKPEKLQDPIYRAEYAEWLKQQG